MCIMHDVRGDFLGPPRDTALEIVMVSSFRLCCHVMFYHSHDSANQLAVSCQTLYPMSMPISDTNKAVK